MDPEYFTVKCRLDAIVLDYEWKVIFAQLGLNTDISGYSSRWRILREHNILTETNAQPLLDYFEKKYFNDISKPIILKILNDFMEDVRKTKAIKG